MNAATDSGLAPPRFEPDDAPPVKLPPGRTLGAVTGMQVSPDGHIWVLHIASNMEWGPPGSLDDPAARLPAVCEFDADGNFIQGWGGPDHLPREAGHQRHVEHVGEVARLAARDAHVERLTVVEIEPVLTEQRVDQQRAERTQHAIEPAGTRGLQPTVGRRAGGRDTGGRGPGRRRHGIGHR